MTWGILWWEYRWVGTFVATDSGYVGQWDYVPVYGWGAQQTYVAGN